MNAIDFVVVVVVVVYLSNFIFGVYDTIDLQTNGIKSKYQYVIISIICRPIGIEGETGASFYNF